MAFHSKVIDIYTMAANFMIETSFQVIHVANNFRQSIKGFSVFFASWVQIIFFRQSFALYPDEIVLLRGYLLGFSGYRGGEKYINR